MKVMTECLLPGQGEVHLNTSLQIFILLLQKLDLLLKEHVLLSLLKVENNHSAMFHSPDMETIM